jgi:hypothetical protein
MRDLAAGESCQLSPHRSICNIFSSCHIRRHDRKGVRGWLASFPLILFFFFPADRALRQRSSQPRAAARSIAAA